MTDLFGAIRAGSAELVRRAKQVRVRSEGIDALAERLRAERGPPPAWDPRTHHAGSPASRLGYVLVLDSINFGSGYFPELRKRPGRSGYYTIAMALKDRFDARGPWSAAELAELEPAEVAAVLGQDPGRPRVAELLDLFAQALRALGALVLERHGGRFEGLVEEAGGSAEALVRSLAAMPFFRDVASYEELAVPFYKRAQLTAADLALALGDCEWGRFRDLDRLTAFADNLVPHVLRLEGVLAYAPELARRIEKEESIEAGSREEVEIRAAAVHSVELLVAALRARGARVTAHELDLRLWLRGQRPDAKARPRHRTRTVYY